MDPDSYAPGLGITLARRSCINPDLEKITMAKKPKTTNPDTSRVDVEYVAKKNFRFQGRLFAFGQEFPWRKLSCSERRVRLLESGGFIISGMVWAERGHEIEEVKQLPEVLPNEVQKLVEEFGLTEYEIERRRSVSEEDDGEPATSPEPTGKRDKDATGGKDQDNK